MPKRKTIPSSLRIQVWRKYLSKPDGTCELDGKCYCCNREIQIDCFECGHIISNKNGGKINMDNLRPICGTCNKNMGTQNMINFAIKYWPNSLITKEHINDTPNFIIEDEDEIEDIQRYKKRCVNPKHDMSDFIDYDNESEDDEKEWKPPEKKRK